MKNSLCYLLLACGALNVVAIPLETLFMPCEIFTATINATTDRELLLATNGIDSLPLGSFPTMIAMCLDSLNLAEDKHLKWDGGQIEDVDMESIPARAIWILNNLTGVALQNIPPGIDKKEGRRIRQAVQNSILSASYFQAVEKCQAAKNLMNIGTNATDETLLALAVESDNSFVLEKLATYGNATIRMAVATNQFASFAVLDNLMKDEDGRVSSAARNSFKQNFIQAHISDSFDQPTRIIKAIAQSTQPNSLDHAYTELKSVPIGIRREILQWLASRLCDVRFSPAPGNESPPPGHDLSLIGGKCAYILEKALMTKLVPVRRDTPIETLNEQRERLIRRIGNL